MSICVSLYREDASESDSDVSVGSQMERPSEYVLRTELEYVFFVVTHDKSLGTSIIVSPIDADLHAVLFPPPSLS